MARAPKTIPTLTLVVALLTLVAAAGAADRNADGFGKNAKRPPRGAQCDLSSYVADLPVESLDAIEQTGLVYLREEEKLARDVYLTLYLEWGNPVFTRIARAERQHLDAVALLLDRHGLEDPLLPELGRFSNAELQNLYDELVARGRSSVEQALHVGATIEDLDLFDLEQQIAATDQADLLTVYLNLAKGSRNHLRSFTFLLDLYDAPYEAQFLSPEQVESIVTTPRERQVVYDETGQPLPCGRR